VRWGQLGETLKLLNGNTIERRREGRRDRRRHAVESLAGIMGGDSTAVSDDTRNIYIEAAFWWPKPWRAVRAATPSRPTRATASNEAWTRR
jgi:phenylalanyl-tRNA synthetase beta chain